MTDPGVLVAVESPRGGFEPPRQPWLERWEPRFLEAPYVFLIFQSVDRIPDSLIFSQLAVGLRFLMIYDDFWYCSLLVSWPMIPGIHTNRMCTAGFIRKPG